MDHIKTVGIRRLKNSLSAYIREVKRGVVILVTDHGNVVAEIRTPLEEYSQVKAQKLKQEWIDTNKLHLPIEEQKLITRSSITLPAGTASRILDLERGE